MKKRKYEIEITQWNVVLPNLTAEGARYVKAWSERQCGGNKAALGREWAKWRKRMKLKNRHEKPKDIETLEKEQRQDRVERNDDRWCSGLIHTVTGWICENQYIKWYIFLQVERLRGVEGEREHKMRKSQMRRERQELKSKKSKKKGNHSIRSNSLDIIAQIFKGVMLSDLYTVTARYWNRHNCVKVFQPVQLNRMLQNQGICFVDNNGRISGMIWHLLWCHRYWSFLAHVC